MVTIRSAHRGDDKPGETDAADVQILLVGRPSRSKFASLKSIIDDGRLALISPPEKAVSHLTVKDARHPSEGVSEVADAVKVRVVSSTVRCLRIIDPHGGFVISSSCSGNAMQMSW